MEEQEARLGPWHWRKRYVVGGIGLLLVLVATILWIQRETIATSYIEEELERLGIEGSYEISDFGLIRQRLINVTVGDPANPDLTIDEAEIYPRFVLGVPEVGRIVARGVRLNGRLVDGVLDLGQLSQLLPEPTGEPFRLPQIELALSDARLRLETPFGRIGIAAVGNGSLQDGFAGQVALYSAALELDDCATAEARFNLAVRIADRRPHLRGPAAASRIQCVAGGLDIASPELAIDAIFSESFDRWGGDVEIVAAAISRDDGSSGPLRMAVGFDGSGGSQTAGAIRGDIGDVRLAGFSSGQMNVDGYYRIRDSGGSLGFDGDLQVRNAQAEPTRIASMRMAMKGAEGTPLEPIGADLMRALEAAAAGFDGEFAMTAAVSGETGLVRLADFRARSASGARLALARGDGLRFGWPANSLWVDGVMELAGGGLPAMRIALSQDGPGAPLEGTAEIAPMMTADARLDLGTVHFAANGNGQTRITTQLHLSGPLVDGRIEGLRIPVHGLLGRGGRLSLGQGCVPVRWSRLQLATLAIGPTELPFCPITGGSVLRYAPATGLTGGGRIAQPRLRARLGSFPLLVSAADFRLPLRRPSFAANNVSVRLGPDGQQSELDIARLSADFVSGGVDGEYIGATGEIAGVPIRLSEAAGDWRFLGGILDVEAAAAVRYSDEDPAFEPLLARNLALHMENNLISMVGTLREPKHHVVVADVDLTHDLNTGVGEAVLETEVLEFNDRLQPSDLTLLVLGIIADVEGLVSGTGTIRWDPVEVTSDGIYHMVDVDLAAPFGPVDGLNGEIRFTDLLGLNTEADQTATVRSINPGVLAEDGVITYQLLSSNRVQVDEARWPFAGGELVLESTILDFRVDQERRLTFRVIGVDAFQFLEARNFENIIATGLFDGKLPMVFDINGGRIEGGRLVSRAGGGTFSYTGEISDVDVGLFGSLAFNALELIRYSELAIEFNGAIDGEMVTGVSFTGVSPNLARERQGFMVDAFASELAEVPIRFNITMSAPFNQMLYSFRLLDDPGFLVNQAIRARLTRIQAERDVQATESDTLP
jgi:hypothetical protein